jgi:hypothetical protein
MLEKQQPCTLLECPPGLFLYRGKMCFKATNLIEAGISRFEDVYRVNAYYIDGGEFLTNLTYNAKDIYSRDHKQVIPVNFEKGKNKWI